MSVIGPTDDWAGVLAARYTLFDSGRRAAELRAALARQDLAAADAARTRQDLALAVHGAFFGHAAALDNRTVAAQNLARSEVHLRLARERRAAGVAPQADVVRAQVEVADAQLAVVRADRLVRVSRGDLATAMGLPVDTPLVVDPKARPVVSPEGIDLPRALAQAVRERPELKAALQRIAVARSAVQGARSDFSPRLLAEGRYGWRDEDFPPGDQDYLVGLALEWPLFAGFARVHRLARSRAELAQEEASTEDLVLRVQQDVWSAHARLQETYQAVQTATVQVADAREAVRLAEERYAVGAGTLNDLLDAQAALARAEANLVGAQWDYHTATAEFQRAIGALAGAAAS